MLEAQFVNLDQGTGIVHCAPSHGPDDFNLCLNNGIKAIETVDGDGKYTNNVLSFEGIHIFKANPIVIEKLKEQKKEGTYVVYQILSMLRRKFNYTYW